jgi:protein-S-isoprenylcysteine O-methyltransferase Ste14
LAIAPWLPIGRLPLPPGEAAWPTALVWTARGLGGVLLLMGGLLALAGLLRLGPNLSVLPHPVDNAELVRSGAYGLVRHPIYSGILLGALGWALLWGSWLALGLALVGVVFFDLKSRREERALVARFPDYAAYQRQVKKLFPFIY